MEASLIANDTDQKTIDNLLKSIENNVGVYRRYLKLKAKLMGLPKLSCHDIVAPLPDIPPMKFTYDMAKTLVERAYSKFDEEYAVAVKEMFTKNHLDSSPRFGKRNGAFCANWYNGKSSFVLNSFNGTLNDVYTIAHELGHATHDYYAQHSQTILNVNVSMVVAETASIFGELLLTDLMLRESRSDQEKSDILCLVLDEAGMAAFQVAARVWFEQSLYESIQKGNYLEYKTICRLWTNARNRIYGDVVEWFEELESEWTMKPHYYLENFRFYNYPYVYAQMFVYALYQEYITRGRDFVSEFKEALAAGSSLSPLEIAKTVNLDITTPDFWNLGMKQFESFVEDLEKTVK
jgi:oligoendopeptidase F